METISTRENVMKNTKLKVDDLVKIKNTHGTRNKEVYQIVGLWPPNDDYKFEIAIISRLIISPIGKFLEDVTKYLNDIAIFGNEKDKIHQAIMKSVVELRRKNNKEDSWDVIKNASRTYGEEYMMPANELEKVD